MEQTKLLVIDVDSLFDSHEVLEPPRCNLLLCDRGNYRDDHGNCHLQRYCSHAFYPVSNQCRYNNEEIIKPEYIWSAVVPALLKLTKSDWKISFWTLRPRKQTFRIIETLKTTGIWYQTLWFSGTSLLLNCLDKDGPDIGLSKLTLLEKVYGSILDWGCCQICAIESDPVGARIIQSYLGARIPVKLAPIVWLELMATNLDDVGMILGASNIPELTGVVK